MKRALKWTVLILVTLIILVVAAPFVAVQLIDPATIKTEVAERVKSATGRDLTIAGDIIPTAYPWLGAEVTDVSLGNAAGFSAPHFVRFRRAQVRVKLIPLLSGNVEMDTVALEGLDLNLARDANGKGNWEDLVAAAGSGGGETASQGTGGALALGGLELSDGRITWDDAVAGQRVSLRDVSLATGAIDLDTFTIPVDTRFAFEVNKPGVAGALSLVATVSRAGSKTRWQLSGTSLAVNATGEALSGGTAEGKLSGDLAYDLATGALSATNLQLDVPGLRSGDLAAQVKAVIDTLEVDTGTLATRSSGLKVTLAEFSAAGMKGSASIDTGLAYSAADGGRLDLTAPVFKVNASGGAIGPKGATVDGKAKAVNVALGTLAVTLDALDTRIPAADVGGVQLDAHIVTSGAYSAQSGSFNARSLKVTGTAAGGALGANGKVPFALEGPLRYDAAKGQVLIAGMKASARDFNASGSRGTLDATGDLLFLIKENRLRSPGLSASGQLAGAALGGGSTRLKLKSAMDLALGKGTYGFDKLDLQLDDLDTQGMKGTLRLRGDADGSAGGQRWKLKGFRVDSDLAGKTLPGGRIDLGLTTTGDVDLAKGAITLSAFDLRTLGLQATGDANVTDVNTSPVFKGKVSVKQFDLKKLLARLGQEVPKTRAGDALRAVAMDANVSGTTSRVRLADAVFKVDGTTLRGNLSADGFPAPRYRFDLQANGINVDSYLPPDTKRQAASPGAAAAAATTLPLDTLRALDMAGNLTVGKLTVAGVRTSAVKVTANAKDGLIVLQPLSARLYSGAYAGNIQLDARGKVAQLSVDERLEGVALEPLLVDVNGASPISGVGQVTARLSTSGNNGDALVAGLNGNVGFNVVNGAIKQINIVRSICSFLEGPGQGGETSFDRMSGSGAVTNGILDNRDLTVTSPLLRIAAGGTIDLPRERLDYSGTASLVKSCAGQGGALRTDLAGIDVPFRLAGPLSNPSPSVDVAAIASQRIQRTVGKKLEREVQKKIGGAVGEQLGTEVQKVLGGALKGLFGQ